MRLLIILLSLGLFSGCETKNSLKLRYKNHVILNPSSWQELADKPIHERFAVANDEVLDYVTLDNKIFDYPERPTPSTLDPSFIEDLRSALASIPKPVMALVDDALQGIVFLENLGSTGYTAYVLNSEKEPAGAFIVMDTQALQRTANEWASWKESTPFNSDDTIRIVSRIETDTNNTRANAIRYVLLHEFAHVLSATYTVHPRFDQEWNCTEDPLKNYPYLQHSWQATLEGCDVSSQFDEHHMPQRAKVRYYSASNLPATEAIPLYRQLKTTNFPTLYAATNWYDDFADSFVNYIHTQIDKRPFAIEIYQHDKLVEAFDGCWNTLRCEAKQTYFENLFEINTLP